MRKNRRTRKKLIVSIVAIFVIIVAVISGLLLLQRSFTKTIDDSYFVSDATKYVLNTDYTNGGGRYDSLKIHSVFFYMGEKITGIKDYYEFANAEIAKQKLDEISSVIKEDFEAKDVRLNGKYIEVTLGDSYYEFLTATEIKDLTQSEIFNSSSTE